MSDRVPAEEAARAAAILRALADLTPSSEAAARGLTIPLEWFRWLPLRDLELFVPRVVDRPVVPIDVPPSPAQPVVIARSFGDKLAAVDALRPTQRSLRVGFAFVAGRRQLPNGTTQGVFTPLVSVPVRVGPASMSTRLVLRAGDTEVTDLITDAEARRRLELSGAFGGGALHDLGDNVAASMGLLQRLPRLRAWLMELAEAAGLPTAELAPAGENPDRARREDGLRILVGIGVYAAQDTGGLGRAGSLRALAGLDLTRRTALHATYFGADAARMTPAKRQGLPDQVSPYHLSPAQQAGVADARGGELSVISGAPGTGKSQTVAAIAMDALARGETVLVSARTDAAIDALLTLMLRAPGPDPIVFGSNERRDELAVKLGGGNLAPTARRSVEECWAELEATATALTLARRSVLDELTAERLRSAGADPKVERARVLAPGLFDPSVDLDELRELLRRRRSASWGRWFRRRRAQRAEAHLRNKSGLAHGVSVDALDDAIDWAAAQRAVGRLEAEGGLDLSDAWPRLVALEDAASQAASRWLAADARHRDRLSGQSLRAVGALATALRSGRAARREQLAKLDDRLIHALPLWLGTLGDIDDLLPPVPALFDLVVLDEASAIDQSLAAAALVRARRAVVVGDPRQLRHVSFVGDRRRDEVTTRHELADDPLLSATLDVRRNSLFDVAAAAAPVRTLDEHHRSDPHLFEFIARTIYGGEVHVATRSPATEGHDCVDIVRVQGKRDRAGVVAAEVKAIVRRLRVLLDSGARSVGVISPFRAQADALEAAVLDAFTVEEIERLGLRLGTVHAFQGNERDLVLVSLGVDAASGRGVWRFVENRNLLTVMLTRARRRMELYLSAEPRDASLLGKYVRQADDPPGRPRPAREPDAWTEQVAGLLAAAGVETAHGYPAGRHIVDLAVPGRRPVGVICGVTGDPEDHLVRHLELLRRGWTLHEAHPSRWEDNPGELSVELRTALDRS